MSEYEVDNTRGGYERVVEIDSADRDKSFKDFIGTGTPEAMTIEYAQAWVEGARAGFEHLWPAVVALEAEIERMHARMQEELLFLARGAGFE